MALNTTLNNTSIISWQSVLLMEKTTDLPQVIKFYIVRKEPYYKEKNGYCLINELGFIT